MNKVIVAILMSAILALTACKGNPDTMSGDSTGTGAVGARTPGLSSTKDTTSLDTTGGGTGDSTKKHMDTIRKK